MASISLVSSKSPWLQKCSDRLQNQLHQAGFSTEMLFYENGDWFFEPLEFLKKGITQTWAVPMDLLPAFLPEDVVIAAVLPRQNAQDILWINKKAFENSLLLKLVADAQVAVFSETQKQQLLAFRPDLVVDVFDPFLEDYQMLSNLSGIVAAEDFFDAFFDKNHFESLPLHPREFIPAPARGAIACLTAKDDLYTRRLLKNLHHAPTASCTNVERRLFQLCSEAGLEKPAAFCEKGPEGNFHLWAKIRLKDGTLKNARLSAPVTHFLAESLFQQTSS